MKMKMRKLVGVIGLSIFWTGCASTSPLSSPEKWQNFNQSAAISTQDLAEDHAMVIFIREPNTIAGSAVNIFVEGEYLTSLQSGGYKAVSLCAMPTNITAAYTDIDLNYPSLREQKNAFDLTRSGIHYFSVAQAENNQLHLKPLTEQQAQQAMQTVQEQVNTLPRLGKNRVCPKVVYQQVQAPEPVIKKYSLAASTLFAYSKSGSQDLLPQGRKEITEIANEIKNNQVQIGHVAVIGYTDPVVLWVQKNSINNFHYDVRKLYEVY